MTPTPAFDGSVDDSGKLTIDDLQRWRQTVRAFIGRQVTLTFGPRRRKRSNAENAYYWAIVIAMICEHCGYGPHEAEAVHEALAMMFLKHPDSTPALPIRRSTAKLCTAEMEEYLENVRRWALTELGLSIPLPNEVV